MSRLQWVPLVLAAVIITHPAPARAQAGAIVNGAAGVVSSDGRTDFVVSGAIGYHFNRALTFGLEFTHVPDLDPRGVYALSRLRLCCAINDDDFEGHATVFTTNVRVDIPTTLHRVIPFVIGGGGVASVTEEFPIYYALPLASQLSALGLAVPTPNILPGPQNFSNTTLAMALTLGGGATIMVSDHVGVDGDLRVLQLLATDGRTVGRFQLGASYRF